MFSLLFHSTGYAKRIFWYSLIEWTLFFGVIIAAMFNAETILDGASLYVLGYIGLGFVFLPLSQIRSVLLILGETDGLELNRIRPSIMLLLRFAGAALTIPTAIALVILFALHQTGYLDGVDLTQLEEDPFIVLFGGGLLVAVNPVLQMSLLLVGLIFLFSFSSAMVPFSAIAANLGGTKRQLDPFFGIGAYKFKSFFITLFILVLDVIVITVSSALFAYLVNTDALIDSTEFPVGAVPISAFIVLFVTYLILIFLQNIWFSACALLFALHKEDAQATADAHEAQMYGHVYDDQSLRALRQARQKS
jgi:hypothetical protein